MAVVTKDEFFLNQDTYLSKIEEGDIFVYPTDTIYGIGGDATNESVVLKIRNIKRQHDRPLSVIAPSIDWIKQNCEVTDRAKHYFEKLPGPYTLILKLKNKNAVAPSVSNSGSIGVRLPNHQISKFAEKFKKPIITTSANISGKDFMTSIEDLDFEIKTKVDFIIDSGEVSGRASSLVYLDSDEIKVKKR